MKILYLAPEMTPYIKTGGLADVAGALPAALRERGQDVVCVLPKYADIDVTNLSPTELSVGFDLGGRAGGGRFWKADGPDGVAVYFLEHHDFYDRPGVYGQDGRDFHDNLPRFANWCRAALELCRELDWVPDVVHANDWQSALGVIYLKTVYRDDPFFAKTRGLYTIHNMAYQGYFSKEQLPSAGLAWDVFTMDGVEFYDDINLMKGGIMYADWISTVSRTYAREIQTPEFGCGLESVLEFQQRRLSGIVNAVDTREWNPATDPLIAVRYSANELAGKPVCKAVLQEEFGLQKLERTPLLGVVARLVEQKGVDLLADVLPQLLENDRVQLVVLGTGDAAYHTLLQRVAAEHPRHVGVRLGFDGPLAHRIEAGADMFVMPSRHEPCGLNQMYSMLYGTLPVVRKTGGLADTVQNTTGKGKGTGFVFTKPEPAELLKTLEKALTTYADREAWTALMKNAMAQDFSWGRAAEEYEALYRKVSGVKETAEKPKAAPRPKAAAKKTAPKKATTKRTGTSTTRPAR